MHMQALKKQYEEYTQTNPRAYLRNIATELNTTEAELLLFKERTVQLRGEVKEVLKRLEELGEVMCITRNASCVHERVGVYSNVSFSGDGRHQIGLAVNPDIDTRLFLNSWKYIFSCNDNGRKSIQFYDKYGMAVHKIFLTDKSKSEAFEKITSDFRCEPFTITIEQRKEPKPELPDDEINVEQFRKDWADLKDTHDFFPMMIKHKVSRTQALRLAGENFARKVENNSARKILEMARDEQCEIMVFVGNSGCIQIHTGKVDNLKEAHGWYNVLDEKFNMHLKEDDISQCWITVKPTVDGNVNALEVFDSNGEMIVQFFGKRKPGIPELEAWRSIIRRI